MGKNSGETLGWLLAVVVFGGIGGGLGWLLYRADPGVGALAGVVVAEFILFVIWAIQHDAGSGVFDVFDVFDGCCSILTVVMLTVAGGLVWLVVSLVQMLV